MSARTRSSRVSPWVGYPLAVLLGAGVYASWIYAPFVLVSGGATRRVAPGRHCFRSRTGRSCSPAAGRAEAPIPSGRRRRETRVSPDLHTGASVLDSKAGGELDGVHLLSYLIVDHETMTLSPTEHIRQGDVVIDVGAHVGVFSHFALKHGAAKVLMLEPDPVNAECLRRNFKDELASGRAILLQEGAWDTESTMTLHTGVANSGSGSLITDQIGSHAVEVRVRPIDHMVAELGLPRIDVIKMDIEGAERHALMGAHSVLGRWKPRILIDMYHLPDDLTVLPQVILAGNSAYRSVCQTCEYREEEGKAVPHVTLFY